MNLGKAIARFDLVGWLGRKGFPVYNAEGRNVYIDCPVCGGQRKLSISKEKHIGRCFKCDEGGYGRSVWNGRAGLFDLLFLVAGLSRSEAIAEIVRSSGYSYNELAEQQEDVDPQWPEDSCECSTLNPSHPAVQFLLSRNCGHLVRSCRVVYAGRYKGRILLPAYYKGALVGWEAKTYCSQKPKSLFPEWFHTGEYLYQVSRMDYSLGYVVITESAVDAETLGTNAVGLYGSTLSDKQLDRLLELRVDGIHTLVWFLDGDAIRKAVNIVRHKTLSLFDNRVVVVSKDEDPNKLGYAACWQAVLTSIPISSEADLLRLLFKAT